jgi:D-hydroxyproline dehydrogenase subunit beta
MNKSKIDLAIVGGGIVGLAIAYAATLKGRKVHVFDSQSKAIGASVRNFGMVWPIGQRRENLSKALRSRNIWLDLAEKAHFFIKDNGSLHLAYHEDELQVLEEFTQKNIDLEGVKILTPTETSNYSKAYCEENLLGALWSPHELTVSPRQALQRITEFLQIFHEVEFHFNTHITGVSMPQIFSAQKAWEVDELIICNGANFESLYPEIFDKSGIIKCKLQMLSTVPQPSGWDMGAHLCGGLTLRHYDSFSDCKSLPNLDKRLDELEPKFKHYGIHVLVSQNHLGQIIIGDSHEYGSKISPFDKEEINQIILDYFHKLCRIPNFQIMERWHGIYAKLQNKTEWIHSPEKGVTIINALGGAGMTLSFGLAEEFFANR